MDIKKIETIATNVVTPVNFTTVNVDFGEGVMPEYGVTYVSAINQKLALRGSSLSFDPVEMTKYLNTLLKYRVAFSSGIGRVDPLARNLLVPALYALTLTHVGSVYDKDLGIQLVPFLASDSKKNVKLDCMSIQEATNFSKSLQIVEDLGFELVEGLPKDKNGESDFMYFHMSEDVVKRHDNRAHPSYAVLAAFFRMKQLEDVLTFRANYGLISEYDEMLKGLIYDEAR